MVDISAVPPARGLAAGTAPDTSAGRSHRAQAQGGGREPARAHPGLAPGISVPRPGGGWRAPAPVLSPRQEAIPLCPPPGVGPVLQNARQALGLSDAGQGRIAGEAGMPKNPQVNDYRMFADTAEAAASILSPWPARHPR
jgi:hypothetical protein